MEKISRLAGGGLRRVLALGAHADDIEIGCGGTLLKLAAENPGVEIRWVVHCSNAERATEARASANAFLKDAAKAEVTVHSFRDGYLPDQWAAVKDAFESLKREFDPELVLTHHRGDLHQDHRVVSDLTWNTFRNHLVLEYEIPKFDGDFGQPGFFCVLPAEILERKIALLLRHFPTQAGKPWFSADLFRAVARLRGMECAAPEGVAEAFYCRKAVF